MFSNLEKKNSSRMSKLPHILIQFVCMIEKLDYSQHVVFFAGLWEVFFVLHVSSLKSYFHELNHIPFQ